MKQILLVALALTAVVVPAAVKAQAPAPATASSPAFAACLLIDDMTKERLDCYDKIIRPEPIQVLQPIVPKAVNDCRYLKEQDARLKCYNRYVDTPTPAPKRKKS